MPTLKVYKDHNNPVELTFTIPDVDNFSAIDRMVLSFVGSDVVVDSDDDADAITWNSSDLKVLFQLESVDIPNGDYPAYLTIVDTNHPLGQVILDPDINNIIFEFSGKPASI